jgi:hypothetical protein
MVSALVNLWQMDVDTIARAVPIFKNAVITACYLYLRKKEAAEGRNMW